MKLDPLNRWLTLGANIGVVIGIVLLITELSQNREMMRSQVRNDVAQGFQAFVALYANREIVDIALRRDRGEAVTPVETALADAVVEAGIRYWENAHYQYRQGLYDDSEFQSHLITMARVFRESPSWRRFFCSRTETYSKPFVDQMIELLNDNAVPCSSVSP